MSSSSHAILVLLGVPACGKSSFVEDYKNYVKEKNIDVVHICYDHLVPLEKQTRLRDEPGEWRELRKMILDAVEFHISRLKESDVFKEVNRFVDMIHMENGAQNERTLFVIDDNNYLQSMRYQYYQIAKQHSIGFMELYFDADLHTALKNNNKRNENQVPENVIEKMKLKLEPPNPLKNPWENFSFVIPVKENSYTNLDLIHSVVETTFDNPVQPKEDDSEERENDRKICSENVLHQVDSHLRAAINKKMRTAKTENFSKEDMRNYSSTCQKIKQNILEEFKSGILDFQRSEDTRTSNEPHNSDLASEISRLFNERLKVQRICKE